MFITNDIVGDNYRIIKQIGAGSFGTIFLGKSIFKSLSYLAEHIITKRKVAIKCE